MAKVGLENDTLNPPKCPSNWEYSTGQRQLLDIQSREQMDRLSFYAVEIERIDVLKNLVEPLLVEEIAHSHNYRKAHLKLAFGVKPALQKHPQSLLVGTATHKKKEQRTIPLYLELKSHIICYSTKKLMAIKPSASTKTIHICAHYCAYSGLTFSHFSML